MLNIPDSNAYEFVSSNRPENKTFSKRRIQLKAERQRRKPQDRVPLHPISEMLSHEMGGANQQPGDRPRTLLRPHRLLPAQRQKVLGALDRLGHFAQQFLQILIAVDKINV
jgi:hypothetical protein